MSPIKFKAPPQQYAMRMSQTEKEYWKLNLEKDVEIVEIVEFERDSIASYHKKARKADCYRNII